MSELKMYGATVGFGVEVEAMSEDEATDMILAKAREIAGDGIFIIDMDEPEDIEEDEDDG